MMSSVPYCRLDNNQCLTLEQVVQAFCAPIKEEHAWAVIHQGILTLLQVNSHACFLIRGMGDIYITKEGLVHPVTFTRAHLHRLPMNSMATGVAELGVAVYDALDWSVSKDSSFERTLSQELENVLDVMTSADDLELLDEGIGEEEVGSRLCEKVLELCRHHLALPGEAAKHYQGVCRVMVHEVLDLSSIISNLSTKELDELEMLDRQEWAGVFNQVMGELRDGVKLRKVNYSRTPTEFSMTPHEMLMDEIKAKKVVLKPSKIPVHVEKAARDIIMDFIKSRPSLKPVAERKLPTKSVVEEPPVANLMNEIRGGKARQSLKRVKVKRSRESLGKIVEKVQVKNKKLIDLDEAFASNIFNFEESPDNSLELASSSPESCTDDEETSKSFSRLSIKSTFSRSCSSTSSSALTEPSPPAKDLTLEEVSHIRSQITVAELEQLDISIDKRSDYDKGRICFLCAKTRFSMFYWAYPCQLCKRQVCKNCCDKIKLPSNKLSEISVTSLRSQLCTDVEEGGTSKATSPFARGWGRSSLSFPSSTKTDIPAFSRSKTLTKTEIERLRCKAECAEKVGPTGVGVSHNVCTDCKDLLGSMVWGRTVKSPKKKSILDIQSMTISKRKFSKS